MLYNTGLDICYILLILYIVFTRRNMFSIIQKRDGAAPFAFLQSTIKRIQRMEIKKTN